jgi:hypothetical protein
MSNDPRQSGHETESEPELCPCWGDGEDRCVLPYGHRGECRDASGSSTLALAAAILGR